MGDYTCFYIGKKDLFHFKYSIGEEFWKVFSLIFNKNEFKERQILLNDKHVNFIGYETNVKNAKTCLDSYNLSVSEIDNSLSKLLDVRRDRLFAKQEYELEDDESFDPRIIFTQTANNHSEYIDSSLYLITRVLRVELDKAQESEAVILDFSDMLSTVGSKYIKNYWENKLKSHITLKRNYLETAKVFFISNDFDLVYIYLTLGLETELYKYAIRKTKKSDTFLFLRSILESEDMKLINKIKLINVLHKSIFGRDLIETTRYVIQTRNSIIHHGGIKKYDRNKTMKSINDISKIIEKLKKL